MSGKPMDPERLADLRRCLKDCMYITDAANIETVRELLDDRDHQGSELARERRMGIEAAERVEMACDLLGDEHGDIVLLAESMAAHAERLSGVVERLTELVFDRGAELMKAEAEAKRWRSQCPVTAEHVEAAGVTLREVLGWTRQHDMRLHGDLTDFAGPLDAGTFAALINAQSPRRRRPAFDILDEMATATPGGDL